ncbi:MAG: hypothetical protein HYU80_02985 [Candidatus Blackburnbacteria bacterium]|nr:hypothetical protein [Candidatus Blackburnbacteria bacterium]
MTLRKLLGLVPSPVLFIFLLAFFLRTYKLAELPVGFHADEVRVGWNAYSILKTGRDDWGNRLPLYYNTFGDFRPTGYFYLTIPSIIAFGTTEFAVRFPGALFGALTIVSLYFFVRQCVSKSILRSRYFTLDTASASALLLALSPWHISLSRATSEGIVAVFLVITGLSLLIYYLHTRRALFLLPALLLLLSSYLFYHSARLLVPLLATTTAGYFWWQYYKNTRGANVFHLPGGKYALLLLLLLFLVTLAFSLNKEARARFSQVSIIHDLDVKFELDKMPFEEGPNRVFIARFFHNKPSVWARRFIDEYMQYISAKFFLVPKEAKPLRYATVGMGILTYAEFALLILGLVALAQKKNYTSVLFLFLFLLSPLPAAITTEDAPNMHRALFMAPFVSVLSAFGLFYLMNTQRHSTLLRNAAFVVVGLNFIFFSHMYLTHNRVNNPLYRNVGAKELAMKIDTIKDVYDEILITNIPDSPYPWIAYFANQDPKVFNTDAQARDKGVWTSNNLVFTGMRCPSRDAFKQDSENELNKVKKLLVVDAEACEAEAYKYNYGENVTILDQIKRPDGTIVYTLWARE